MVFRRDNRVISCGYSVVGRVRRWHRLCCIDRKYADADARPVVWNSGFERTGMRSAYRRVFSAGVTLMLLAGASAGLLNGLKGLSEKQVTENRKQFEARRLREVLSSV